MKNVFIVSGGIIAGYSLYKLGEFVGYIKSFKMAVDIADEVLPGVKEDFARKVANGVVDKLFHKDEEVAD